MAYPDMAMYKEEIKRCKRLYKGFSEAEPFIEAVCDAVERFFKDNAVEVLPVFDAGEAEEKMRKGESVRIATSMDPVIAIGLLKAISKATTKANPDLKNTLKELNSRYDEFLAAHTGQVTKDDLTSLRDSLIKDNVLEKDLATFLFSFLLSSLYRQQLDSIIEVLRTDLWEGGDCPLCGVKPHYGLLTQEEGKKQLDCWLCGTVWEHTRIKCPFCNNSDHERLGYFTLEDNENCRVNFCQDCCQYYKIFDTRKFHADGKVVLSIHNLATLNLDLVARKEGFTPGSRLEWVNDSELEKSDRQN